MMMLRYSKGSLDNLPFYNRVLSEFEVNQLYRDKTPRSNQIE